MTRGMAINPPQLFSVLASQPPLPSLPNTSHWPALVGQHNHHSGLLDLSRSISPLSPVATPSQHHHHSGPQLRPHLPCRLPLSSFLPPSPRSPASPCPTTITT
ncbi:unnamed protein product, partial [Closterium sp. Yama58-4]